MKDTILFALYKSSMCYTFILKSVFVPNRKAKAWSGFAFSVSASCRESLMQLSFNNVRQGYVYFVLIFP